MELKKDIQRVANRAARDLGFGRANEIVIIEGSKPKILSRVDYGWRKITTDEYVPNAYRNNFGWKNTYYQPAWTVIGLPKHMAAE